jgi:hypothetical protein
MRPTVTLIQKQKTAKRKNHAHWVAHKHEIFVKRSMKKGKVKRLQRQNINSFATTELQINDIFTYLSINEKTNDEDIYESNNNNIASDVDFESECLIDLDEDKVILESENESEDFNEEEEIEEDLNEEQIAFGDDFFSMDNSTLLIRDYDEVVSCEILSYLFSFFRVIHISKF